MGNSKGGSNLLCWRRRERKDYRKRRKYRGKVAWLGQVTCGAEIDVERQGEEVMHRWMGVLQELWKYPFAFRRV